MNRCPCCMEVHERQTISIVESNRFKSMPIEYKATYFYCSNTDELYADEQQISANDIAKNGMKLGRVETRPNNL